MCEYIITQIYPGIEAMQWVHYAGIIVFGGYLALCLFFSRPKPKKEKYNRRNKGKNNKKQKTKRVNLNNRF